MEPYHDPSRPLSSSSSSSINHDSTSPPLLSISEPSLRFPKPQVNEHLARWISFSHPDIMRAPEYVEDDLLAEFTYELIHTPDNESHEDGFSTSSDDPFPVGTPSIASIDPSDNDDATDVFQPEPASEFESEVADNHPANDFAIDEAAVANASHVPKRVTQAVNPEANLSLDYTEKSLETPSATGILPPKVAANETNNDGTTQDRGFKLERISSFATAFSTSVRSAKHRANAVWDKTMNRCNITAETQEWLVASMKKFMIYVVAYLVYISVMPAVCSMQNPPQFLCLPVRQHQQLHTVPTTSVVFTQTVVNYQTATMTTTQTIYMSEPTTAKTHDGRHANTIGPLSAIIEKAGKDIDSASKYIMDLVSQARDAAKDLDTAGRHYLDTTAQDACEKSASQVLQWTKAGRDMRDRLRFSVLQHQIEAKLWWLRVQRKTAEHDLYKSRAEEFLRSQKPEARQKKVNGNPMKKRTFWMARE